MKRTFKLLITITLITLLFGCSTNVPNQVSSIPVAKAKLKAKVIKLYDNSMLVASMEANEVSSYLYSLSTDLVTENKVLKPGAVIEVGYDGMIMESYPAKLDEIKYIKFIEQKDDLVGLYENVFTKLWETDEGLNSDINSIAFDLTKVNNLTNKEKSALTYVLGNKYGLETITGTFEELCEQGYIDKKNLIFKNGILLSINVFEECSNTFKFNAEKWRSGRGAYFFNDCTAKKTKHGWEYKIGGEAIS